MSTTQHNATGGGSRPRTWSPGLDLTDPGLAHFDPKRVTEAIRAGRDAGYEAGLQAGMRDGRRRIDEELVRARAEAAQLLDAISRAASELAALEGGAASVFADHVVDLALEVAAAIVDRELADDHSRATEAVRRAISPLERSEDVTVKLHPDDAALVSRTDLPANVRIVGDPRIEPGGAVAVTDEQTVDARISTALERARAALEGHR